MAAPTAITTSPIGAYICTMCDQQAIYTGYVGIEDYKVGHACAEHWPDLKAVVRDLAKDWRPCPCPNC